jgi:hypothetical protein
MAPYGWEEMGVTRTVLVLAVLAVCAAACMWSVLKLMTPAGRYTVPPELVPWLAVGALTIGTAASFQFEQEDTFWASSWVCLKIGLSIAIPTAVLVWLVIRRGVFLVPGLTGANTGVLAGLVAAAALEVHCPNLDAWHILVSHLGTAICAGLVGLLAGVVTEGRSAYRQTSNARKF